MSNTIQTPTSPEDLKAAKAAIKQMLAEGLQLAGEIVWYDEDPLQPFANVKPKP